MASGRSPEVEEKVNTQKGSATFLEGNRNKSKNSIEPFVARGDHNARDLRSWAKRTGFVSYFSSGEVVRSSGTEKDEKNGFDLEKKPGSSSPKVEIDPILGRTRNRIPEHDPNPRHGGRTRNSENEVQPIVGGKDEEARRNGLNINGKGVSASNVTTDTQVMERKKENGNVEREEIGIDMGLDGGSEEPSNGGGNQSLRLKCGLRENPGFVPLIYYGMQHYFSLAGSLIFIPLIIVPAMGGTDRDTATVISTIMLVTGVTTILHSYFGTRLPLVQGSSFVYLAPALVIINAREYRNLTEHKFRNIMRELQGAIIVGSIFQFILGFSGLMSFFLRLINPVVVAPTVAAVGLAFVSYAFPQAGSCVAISIPQILLVLIFTLYLRGLSVYGHRIFQIYAVPLSGLIIWVYASFLTAGGAYNYKGCSPDIPSSNILIDSCKKHAYTMKHCRTDVSDAWRTADWVRIPYPLQWGIPIFRLRTSIIMTIVTLVASVDSVGAYHSASMRINSKPPTPGTVSRGIGLEGFCSVLAGLWGTGTGSTTLTENVHTIGITKVASRRAVVLGAALLVVFSFVGKVGAILASIPQALAAALLCFVWALIVALGLLTLQYTQTASFRNIMIVGVSLFFGLSIPSYFQQYQPESSLILPAYYIPYSAASDGPIRSGNNQFDFAMNALLSMNMVVTLLVAIVLDNTVPGNQQERGVYRWSSAEDLAADPSILADYSLPGKISRFFHWPRCLGA